MEDYKLRLKPVKELVSILQEMNLSVTEADLYRPSSHRTTIIFETLINIFGPAKYRLIEEVRVEATKRVITLTGSSPDTCSHETIVIFEVFRSFLKTIRFSDIALTDLTHPTSRRIIPIYNVIVNFAIFCQPRWKEYMVWAEKIEETSVLTEEAHNVEEDTRKEFNYKKNQKLKDEEERQYIESINDELMIELGKLKKEADEMSSNLDDHKKERHKLKDTLQGSQYFYLEDRNNFDDFKLYRDIDLDKGFRECDSLRTRIEEITRKLTHLQNTDIRKCIRYLLNIKSKTAEINRQVKSTEAVENELENFREEESEMSKMKSQFKMEVTNCQVEMELIEEQAAKSAETMELYYKDTEEKNFELKKFIDENLVKESKCKEEMKGYEEEHKKILYVYNYEMHQITNKLGSIQSHIERLYQHSQN
ncbi:hypothetical protein INT48_004173 [Thamnidium elegans]|uniref:Kinetochore protein Nuf2 N-terminal domain-containing protein n=1 Tax=Thamnidium elegans TaxID=101142 RepID=A0A8H7SUJ5_9FUNG|nr:hypothetical protein INT48_004173 [Thamnidium elegans]